MRKKKIDIGYERIMNGYIEIRKMKCGKRGEKNNGKKRRTEI